MNNIAFITEPNDDTINVSFMKNITSNEKVSVKRMPVYDKNFNFTTGYIFKANSFEEI